MIVLLCLLVASTFIGSGMFTIDVGIAQLTFYRIMLMIMLLYFTFLFLKNDSRLNLKTTRISSRYIWFYVTWVIYAILSVIWAIDPIGWAKGVFFIATGVFSIISINLLVRTKKDLLKVSNVFFLMILFHNIIGWIELLFGVYWFADLSKVDRYNTFFRDASTRIPISSLANQNDYATMLVAGVFLSLTLIGATDKKIYKSIYCITMISSLYLIYRTQSRANILAIIVGLLLILFVLFGHVFINFFKREFKTLKNFIILFIIVLLFIFSLESFRSSFSYFIENNFNDGSSNLIRFNLILNGFYFLLLTFGLGVGAGNIEYWMKKVSLFEINEIINIHNWWMEILTGYGIVIFFMYIIMYLSMALQLIRFYQSSNIKVVRNSSLIILGYLGAFVFSSMSPSSIIQIEWQWLIWGMIIAYLRLIENQMTYKESTYIGNSTLFRKNI